ncbi:MAG: hypothetical protein NTW86_02805 [Candidatus Sumerlaeota bacterium]|nr:hypothetical protein [Candidatus Sumerlaeota bacterium]
MKITEIKTFVVGNPWKNWTFVKVFTDEGLTGVGETTAGLSAKPEQAAAVAEAAGASVALHQAQSPLNTALNAHLRAAMPNFLIQECFDDFLAPWARDVVRGAPRVRDGCLEPSDAPGLGVELDEAEIARHPYGQGFFLRLFEEGWEQREPARGPLPGH